MLVSLCAQYIAAASLIGISSVAKGHVYADTAADMEHVVSMTMEVYGASHCSTLLVLK